MRRLACFARTNVPRNGILLVLATLAGCAVGTVVPEGVGQDQEIDRHRRRSDLGVQADLSSRDIALGSPDLVRSTDGTVPMDSSVSVVVDGARVDDLRVAPVDLRVVTSPDLAQLPASASCTDPTGKQWAFCEDFTGAPAVPTPWSSPRFDVVVDEWMSGQTLFSDGTFIPNAQVPAGPIEVGYGPHCEPPSQMTRTLYAEPDERDFAQGRRNDMVFQCSNRLATVCKAGYAIVSYMPRQQFDWAGRTGTIEFDANLFTFAREWWDLYIVPENEMLMQIAHINEGGDDEQHPRRAVKIKWQNRLLTVIVIDNYEVVSDWSHWQRWEAEFPNDPAVSNPDILRRIRINISNMGWGFAIQKVDGTFKQFTGTFPQPLSFSRGNVKVEHHCYNPTKDGIPGTPWSRYTYSWDNFKFDGPAVAPHRAFEPTPTFVRAPSADPNGVSEPIMIDVLTDDLRNPVLCGQINSELLWGDVDPDNTQHWRQLRVNGGPWLDFPLVKPGPEPRNRTWSTFRLPVSNVVKGRNVIEFRNPLRPTTATWHRAGYSVKEVEIRLDP